MKLFDTHAHYADEKFDLDRDTLIPSLYEQGIDKIVEIACDVRTAQKSIDIIDKYPFVYGAVGMHPHEAAETTNEHMDMICDYLKHEKMLALGEIGLDYYYDFAPRDVQMKWFDVQLDLAEQLNVPVVLHIREAFGDCMDILRSHRGRFKGVMHCFSGSKEIAYECVDMGLYVAFGGSVTFKNANKLLDAVKAVPIERLVLETDCPYMTPVPHRGKRNDSSYMKYTLERIAQLREMDIEELAYRTYENAVNMYEIKV